MEQLISAYLEHWQIEVNHREEKTILGVGQAQVRNDQSVPRQPAFVVATYALLLLAALRAHGPSRTADYLPPPKWGRSNARPSALDIIALLRQQATAHPSAAQPGAPPPPCHRPDPRQSQSQGLALNLILKAAA